MNIACQAMTAARLHKIPKIYFIGSFCTNNLLGQMILLEVTQMTQSFWPEPAQTEGQPQVG